ncbi:PREDICTED: basic 7S globulin-like [Nicotiana attenuata]|uniref:Basic 7s globulin n=1 Tax=Nicotiana attenuata TaxID=49451 RepID=A0A1J6IMH0_NICAT|nr:PREDICTED: basic 7S globulin-like [Nicotiana attenuata]OIS98894.1 basic 7s globulin [Nicotiana attenuata]
MLSFSSMVTFKLPLFSNYTFFFLFLSLCSAEVLPTTLYLPVTKDSSTLQYTTVIGQRTPLVPIKLTVHLGGISLWVDCDIGYNSSTYHPARCNSTLCSFAKSHSCGDCIFKPQIQPGCNNNTCYNWGENPLINTYMDRAEIAEDVLAIGSTPGILVTLPRFIFSCVDSSMSKDLAEGVTGIAGFGHQSPVSIPNQLALDPRFARKFGICLSSSTSSRGVIFIGSGPYNFYNPKKVDISNNLVYTKLITNPRAFLQSSEYHIEVSSIRIAGKDVPLNKTLLSINKKNGVGGTRIKTTTPFTILDNSIYNAVKTAFLMALPKNVTIVEPPMKQFGACFSSKNIRNTNVGPDVPVIDFVLHKKSAYWRIYGANSVVQVTKDVMCLAFVGEDQTWEPSIVIGGHQMEENLLVFDLARKRIGFSSSLKLQKTSCAKYDYTSKS